MGTHPKQQHGGGRHHLNLPHHDSAAVSIFVVILVELTNTVFVNSTNMTTNIETAVLSKQTRADQEVRVAKLLRWTFDN